MAEQDLNIGLRVKDQTGGKLKEAQKDVLGLKNAATSAIPGFSLMTAGLAVAGVAAVRAGWQLAQTGAQVKQLSDSFGILAQQAGESSSALLASLKAASGGTVAESSLMLSANRAMMLGLGADAEKLGELMEVARFRGRAMGLTTEQAFSDIVTGIGRMSPLILDNLGIVMDAEKVFTTYAKSIGVTADALTDAQKKQVLLNQVVQIGQQQIDEAGDITDNTADKFERLAASWRDLKEAVGTSLAPAAGEIADAMSELANAINPALDAQRARLIADVKFYSDVLANAEGGLVLGGTAMESDYVRALEETRQALIELDVSMATARQGVTAYNSEVAKGWSVFGAFTKTNAENESLMRSMAQNAKDGTGNFSDFAGAVKDSQTSVTGLTNAVALFKMVTGDLPATFQQLMTVVNAYGGYSNQLKEYFKWGFVGSTIMPEADKWKGQQGATERGDRILASRANDTADSLKDLGTAAKDAGADLRSSIKGLMTPTSVTRLDELETKFGVYKPKWDEPMRRVQDVIQQGEKSPWAKQYFGDATGEQLEMKALQFQRDWGMGLYNQLPLSQDDWSLMQQGLARGQLEGESGAGQQDALAGGVAAGLEAGMMPEDFAGKAIDAIKTDMSENQEQIKELGKTWGDYFWPGASASTQFVATFVNAAFPGILAKLKNDKYYSGGVSEE